MADLTQTLIEADALLRIARTAMQRMRLEGLGSDCRLSHEVRMFALEFSGESRDGPGVLQVNGTGRALKCLEALRDARAQSEPVMGLVNRHENSGTVISDDDRAAFEQWMRKTHKRPGTHFTRSGIGDIYTDNRVAAKWAAWKAALNYAREPNK